MAQANSRRAQTAIQRGRAANAAPAPSSLDRELRDLERRGLARVGEGGTVAVTSAGLAFLERRFPRDGRR